MQTLKPFKTEQEAFWAGDFGRDYIDRNRGDALLASNLNFFSQALKACDKLNTCIEFGANIGMNLKALQLLYPTLESHAIEINTQAVTELGKVVDAKNIYAQSILEFKPQRQWDLVLIKGVLIHIHPDMLSLVYEKLVQSTRRFLLVAEYYNPTPVSLTYRGEADRLFKRDFAGEILDQYPNVVLRDYGFSYRRDPQFPQDDITWFLLEKK